MKQRLLFTTFIVFLFQPFLFAQSWHIQPVPVQTRWAKQVSPTNALKEYPRPQMVRAGWQNLNGLWQYAITNKTSDYQDSKESFPTKWDGEILVPYPIESALSGVKKMVQPNQNLWYKRSFVVNTSPGSPKANHPLESGIRYLLHFGAVDWQTTVFINGKELGSHTGGYDNFSFDITDALKNGANEIVVKVYDPTDQGPNPHGKQVLHPENIWYTPTTGIWQTVWMERAPENYISDVKITPDVDKSEVVVTVTTGKSTNVSLTAGNDKVSGKSNEAIHLEISNPHLWSPSDPFLYNLIIKAGNDEVKSYFGLRKVEIKKDEKGFDRIFLNNKYVFNLGVLDQGFWPDGIYTAPTDEALAFDIKAIKAMGFNTIRKHIKREPDRWYYWCDKLGMVVWQDMINPSFNLNDEAKKEFEKECKENITELYNHPCITTYTLFNEKWGQYDQERLTKWIKELDPTRLVNGHSGEYLYVNEKLRSPSPNAYIESDLTDVHSYPDPMNSIRMDGKARVLGEFGGIGVFIPDHQWNTNSAWGYIQVTPSSLKGKYTVMNQHLKLLEREGLSASIYTQPFDVEGEQNGLMTYDREIIKIPFEDLRKIHSLLVSIPKTLPQVVATNADVTDPTIKYSRLLQQYVDGKRDATFLKKLAIAAQQVGDKPGLVRATTDYFAFLKKPYSTDDLQYVMQVTNKTTDPGFSIIQQNADAIDKALGGRSAEVKLMNFIYTDEIAPSVSGQNPQPNWNALAASIKKYGAPGEEILLRAKAIHYLNHQDFENFVNAADEYISKYGEHIRTDELNQFAWTAFEKLNNPQLLLKAAEWSRLSLRDGENGMFLDTQANLLYKAGKKEEAISLQEKAVQLSGDQSVKDNLEKMKKGEATWPGK